MGWQGSSKWRAALLCTPLLACRASPEPEPEHDLTLVIDPAPEDDLALSPFTGWTRDHHVALFGRLVVGHAQHRSPGDARWLWPGAEHPATMEGSTRLLPVLAAWLSNPDNPVVIEYEGVTVDVAELGRSILLAGTDPDHLDYWGAIAMGWDQRSVEAAAVADALLRAPLSLWDPITPEERTRILAWLSETDDTFPNNWVLFVATRNLARKLLGASYDPTTLSQQFGLLDALYAGDGWYSDGVGAQFDFYNGFVIHPRLLAWSAFDPAIPFEQRSAIHVRAQQYLDRLPYLFDSEGAVAWWGRSMAYRSAHLWTLALAEEVEANPLSAGLTRRLVSGALSWDVGGAPDSVGRAFSADHVLNNGLWGDDPRARESYMGDGSHYFWAQSLGLLAFGPEHPVWTATEEPLPADEGPFAIALPGPGLAVTSAGPGTPVTVLNAVAAKGDESKYHDRYRKLAYASRFPFNTVDVDGGYPYDGMVTASFDGQAFLARTESSFGAVASGWMTNRYGVGAAELSTATWARGEVQVRFTCLDAGAGSTFDVLDGSFPLGVTEAGPTMESGTDALVLTSESGSIGLWARHGFDRVEGELGFRGEAAVNAVHDRSWIVAARADAVGAGRCFVSEHRASLDPLDVQLPGSDRVTELSVDEVERTMQMRLGDARVFSSVGSPVDAVAVGGVTAEGAVLHLSVTSDHAVAYGASSLRDTEGALVAADPGFVIDSLDWRLVGGRVRVVATHPGSPLRVRGPGNGVGSVWVRLPGGSLEPVEDVEVNGDVVTLSMETLDRYTDLAGATQIGVEVWSP